MNSKRNNLITYLKNHRNVILDEWERRAYEDIKGAKNLPPVELRNLLVEFLRSYEESLKIDANFTKKSNQNRVKSNGKGHGKHRAATENYTVVQLIKDYEIMRQVLVKHTTDKNLLGLEENELLTKVTIQSIMSAVDEFIKSIDDLKRKISASLVHDIKSPLTVLNSTIQLLRRDEFDEDRLNRFIQISEKAIDRIDSMTDDILDVYQIQAGDALKIDFDYQSVCDALNKVIYEAQLKYGDIFETDFKDCSFKATFGKDALTRVLENLISNAIKYGDSSKKITIGVQSKNKTYSIYVHNWGPVLSKKEQENIFNAFERADSAKNGGQEGWGIGLSVVRSVVEGHGGKVYVESNEESGTSFIIELPVEPPRKSDQAHIRIM